MYNTSFKNISNQIKTEIAKGNFSLNKEAAIAKNMLAGDYRNGKLVNPYPDVNAEIAAEAALAGVPNTIFSDWVKNNASGITSAINNILNPGNPNSNTPNASGSSTYPGPGLSNNSPTTGSGFDWSSLIPWAVAALIILGILKWKKVI